MKNKQKSKSLLVAAVLIYVVMFNIPQTYEYIQGGLFALFVHTMYKALDFDTKR